MPNRTEQARRTAPRIAKFRNPQKAQKYAERPESAEMERRRKVRKHRKANSQKGQKAQKGAERTFWGWSAKKIGAKRGGSTGG